MSSPVRKSPVIFRRKRGRRGFSNKHSSNRRVTFFRRTRKNGGRECVERRGYMYIIRLSSPRFLGYSRGARVHGFRRFYSPIFYYLDIRYRIIRVYKGAYARHRRRCGRYKRVEAREKIEISCAWPTHTCGITFTPAYSLELPKAFG